MLIGKYRWNVLSAKVFPSCDVNLTIVVFFIKILLIHFILTGLGLRFDGGGGRCEQSHISYLPGLNQVGENVTVPAGYRRYRTNIWPG